MRNILLLTTAFTLLFANTARAERYKVFVRRTGNDTYVDQNSGTVIQTSLCLVLTPGGEEAILIWDYPIGNRMYGGGQLLFLSSGDSCQVDGVY